MENKIFDYHTKDSRELDLIIKKPIVDVIITSPPYWNLKNYGVAGQVGFGQKYDEYLNDLINIFEKCKNVLKDYGSIWIVADSFKQHGDIKLLPFDLANRLKEKGFFLQDIIIWQKDKTLPWSSKGKLRNIFEYILFFTKSKQFDYYVDELREVELKKWWPKYPERYNPKGKVPSRVWEIPIPMQGWGKSWVRHFCPFPPRLIENILLLTTKKGSVVLDPFAGSGSVLAQANVMGRRAIGFDLNSDYKKMYCDKVLPFFKALWVERKKELDATKQKRKYLAKTILSLRKIKYPLQLYRELKKKYSDVSNRLNFIIVEDTEKTNYYFVFDEISNNLEEKILSIIKNEKMKKFSISSNFKILTLDKIPNLNFNIMKYLYEKGINNYYTKQIIFNKWLQERKDTNLKITKEKIPPIISNIKVSQKNHLINF